MPLGRFSEQIDYDIRLANTAPLIEEQRVVDIDRLTPLYVYNILLVRHGKTVFGIRQRVFLSHRNYKSNLESFRERIR